MIYNLENIRNISSNLNLWTIETIFPKPSFKFSSRLSLQQKYILEHSFDKKSQYAFHCHAAAVIILLA